MHHKNWDVSANIYIEISWKIIFCDFLRFFKISVWETKNKKKIWYQKQKKRCGFSQCNFCFLHRAVVMEWTIYVKQKNAIWHVKRKILFLKTFFFLDFMIFWIWWFVWKIDFAQIGFRVSVSFQVHLETSDQFQTLFP